MSSFITPQNNLLLQIVILAVLFASVALKRMRKYPLHGVTMLLAVVLNAISFLLVMGPSLSSMREFIILNVFNELAVVTVMHAALGTVAEVLGIWLIASWHFQSNTRNCVRKKKIMRGTLLLWVVALVFGIIAYLLLYPVAYY